MLDSSAHLLFLSKFLKPQEIDGLGWIGGHTREEWEDVLSMSVTQAFHHLYADELVEQAALLDRLLYKYKVIDLKEMLKHNKLPVTGKKIQLATRLIQFDTQRARELVEGLVVFKCTEKGRQIAENYVVKENERKAVVEQEIWEALQIREFEIASQKVAKYQASQVFPKGMSLSTGGMKSYWENYDHTRKIKTLKAIFSENPKALLQLQLTNNQIEECRMVVAMEELWSDWQRPDEFRTANSSLRKAVGMLKEFVNYQNTKTQLKKREVKFVNIVGFASGSARCSSCQELTNKRYKIEEVPELPHESCTYLFGCQCKLKAANVSADEVIKLINRVARLPVSSERVAIAKVFNMEHEKDILLAQNKLASAYLEEVIPAMVEALDSEFGRPCWKWLLTTWSDNPKDIELNYSGDFLLELLRTVYNMAES